MTRYDHSNIFAKILRGEIPCHKVYEDSDALAFMDVMPQCEGHCLVVPKQPSRGLLDADPQILSQLIDVVQKVASAVVSAMGADGFQIRQYNEVAGGQTVFHLHFHILPLKVGEALKPHSDKMADHSELARIAASIRAAIA